MKRVVFALVAFALVAGAVLWWTRHFRRTIVLEPRISRALAADPWIPARRLLASRGLEVRDEPSLAAILQNIGPRDVLLLPDLEGVLAREVAGKVRSWVRRGGHLVVSVENHGQDGMRDCLLADFGVDHASLEDAGCPESWDADSVEAATRWGPGFFAGQAVDGESEAPEFAGSEDSSSRDPASEGEGGGADDGGEGNDMASAGSMIGGDETESGSPGGGQAGANADEDVEDSSGPGEAGGAGQVRDPAGLEDAVDSGAIARVADSGATEWMREAAGLDPEEAEPRAPVKADEGVREDEIADEPALPGQEKDTSVQALRSDARRVDGPQMLRRIGMPDGDVLETGTYFAPRLRWKGRGAGPAWIDAGGDLLLARVAGGSVAVIADAGSFSGRRLRQRDHGELLLRLVQRDGEKPVVWIARYGRMPKWYGWFWERAWPALLALLVLAALGMRRAAARFGPVEPGGDAERANLLEHAAAAGRWLWSLPEGPDILAVTLRASTLAAVRARRPELTGLDAAALARALAAEGRASERDIARALDTASPGDPAGFLKNARTLWIIRRTT